MVAVCQTPGEQAPQTAGNTPGAQPPAAAAPAGTQQATAEVTPKEEESLTKQAIGRVSRILPSTEGIKHLLGTPVRMVENSYSWIAKRFDK
ncbi:hypothetical protein D3C72_2181050 [compost metagenome]